MVCMVEAQFNLLHCIVPLSTTWSSPEHLWVPPQSSSKTNKQKLMGKFVSALPNSEPCKDKEQWNSRAENSSKAPFHPDHNLSSAALRFMGSSLNKKDIVWLLHSCMYIYSYFSYLQFGTLLNWKGVQKSHWVRAFHHTDILVGKENCWPPSWNVEFDYLHTKLSLRMHTFAPFRNLPHSKNIVRFYKPFLNESISDFIFIFLST